MRLNAAAIMCVVSAVVLTSCRSSDVDKEPTTTTSPTTVTIGQTVQPATSGAVTTSTSVTTTTAIAESTTTTLGVAESDETWIGFQRRDFPGYAVELVEVESGRRITLPLDRRFPYVHQLLSDLEGGLILAGPGPPFAPVVALAAGATEPMPLSIEGDPISRLDTVVDLDGGPALLYLTISSEWDRDENDEWSETEARLIVHPLGVLIREVVDAGYGWAADSGVMPVVIVSV